MSTNQMKTCLICLNTIRRDHVKTHIKRHFPKIEELDEHEIHEISQHQNRPRFWPRKRAITQSWKMQMTLTTTKNTQHTDKKWL